MAITVVTSQYENSDWVTALEQVKDEAQWQVFPKLTTEEVEGALLGSKAASIWVAGKAVKAGAWYTPSVPNGHVYTPNVSDTTGATEPTWPTWRESTVADEDITWTEAGPAPINNYIVRDAVAKCWALKAAKASALMATQSPEQRNDAQQVFEHCKFMMGVYACTAIA